MRIILHLDMNSYFASVEQQANPLLRGKPVGVCAYKSERGCIIAASIEAKAVGVTTGMRVREAVKKCPRIILIENEPAKYRTVTADIFGIIHEYSDRFEPYSIDEAFIDLTGWAADWATATSIAETIRARIQTEVGDWLRCSVGISWTRWLAKFASDLAPKNGTTCITPSNLDATIHGKKLVTAWGIKWGWARRLNDLGIFTLDQLRAASPSRLQQTLGMQGYYLWANLNGIETTGIQTGEHLAPKSIGHSYCVPRHTTDRAYLDAVLLKLSEKTGRRLRAAELEASGISAWLSFVHGGSSGASRRLTTPLYTTADIFTAAHHILFATPLPEPVRFVAVTVTRLHPGSGQTSLFNDQQRTHRLTHAQDRINNRWGEYTIASGAMWQAKTQAPDRVGYRKTVAPRELLHDVVYQDDMVY